MKKEFNKAYDPTDVEKKWYDIWQRNEIYKTKENSTDPAYSILMPPPNVTGILHFGHVLNQTLQDLYIRSKRMQGFNVCWFPGTDHAGIATQARVEAELRKEHVTRYDLGREEFVAKVWEWKTKYGGIILQQLRELGLSCDWDKTLFTMDESASNAVREAFIQLFDEGLIYKGKRLINWSPLSQTALSDEEVEFRQVHEKLYTLRYFLKGSDEYLCVATVRNETIFGDVAVAVHPNDERYRHLIGKNVIVPLVGRIVPIIADEHADPEFGTGCVKITPAHDPNDFEVGMTHNLETINTINPDGTLNENAGEYKGLDRFVARKKISKKLEELGLIEKVEDYAHNVGFSQRGGEAVEPFLSSQWFVSMKPLAEIALKEVLEGEINFYPSHWIKTYEHWMTNIRDWCISRQLWWGHRIPVYYTEDGRYTAASSEEEAKIKLGLDSHAILHQDEDVLDTWFSSWLWPLTTMKWKADGKIEWTDDLRRFLPTDLLVTAPDIIFFWVARMIMATKKFKGTIPFKNVYFTSTIRDAKGRKLSKSLGNSPDPLDIIAKYGADAVRFTMIYLSPLGQDIKLDIDLDSQDIPSMEIGRNFANKIWNAGRFIIMKKDQLESTEPAKDISITANELSSADKWILSRYHNTIRKLNDSLENYKVNDYSKILYDFIWRDFCDWYLEILKVELSDPGKQEYNEALIKFVLEIYEGILKLLHPIMPFITEEIWHIISEADESQSISLQPSPSSDESKISPEMDSEFELMQMIVDELRKLRANAGIPPQTRLPVTLSCQDEVDSEFFAQQKDTIISLAKCSYLEVLSNGKKPHPSLVSVVRGVEIFLGIGDAIDVEKERDRLMKEAERLERNIAGSESKLSNDKFVANAPAEIVNYEKDKLESMKSSLEKIKLNLENLIQQ